MRNQSHNRVIRAVCLPFFVAGSSMAAEYYVIKSRSGILMVRDHKPQGFADHRPKGLSRRNRKPRKLCGKRVEAIPVGTPGAK